MRKVELPMNFRTHVILGEELKKKTDIPQKYHSRSILTDLNKYIQSNQTTDIVFLETRFVRYMDFKEQGKPRPCCNVFIA